MQLIDCPAGAMVATPDRSLSQRLEALEVANRIRCRRAQLKRDVKAGRVETVDVLAEPAEWVETMKVLELLLATPKLGRVKAGRLLRDCDVSPSKTVGGMTERQRRAIVQALWAR